VLHGVSYFYDRCKQQFGPGACCRVCQLQNKHDIQNAHGTHSVFENSITRYTQGMGFPNRTPFVGGAVLAQSV
jgi:hypothetical protein